jgi:hypothetical protein
MCPFDGLVVVGREAGESEHRGVVDRFWSVWVAHLVAMVVWGGSGKQSELSEARVPGHNTFRGGPPVGERFKDSLSVFLSLENL